MGVGARNLVERVPTHLLVAASAWGSRVVTAATGLFMVRILTRSLGTEQYAAYAILGGLAGWYSLADMGLGSSLQNFISERRAKGDPFEEYIAAAAATGFIFLLLFGAALFVASDGLGGIVLRHFALFSPGQKGYYFLVYGLLAVASAIGGISFRIWFAVQKGYLANLLPAAASVLSFLLVLAVSVTEQSRSLFWMILAGFGPLAVMSLLIFAAQAARLRCRITAFDGGVLRPLVVRGLKFWLSGVLAAGVLQIDYLVMSQYLVPKDIVVYNLSSKIFLLIFFVYSSLLSAIWPVFAEATAAGDWAGLFRHVRKIIFLGVALVLAGTLLFALFKDQIIALLSPKEAVDVPYGLIALFGLYYLLRAWSDVFGIVLQSMSYMRPFVIYIPFQALINVLVQVVVTRAMGVTGILVGLIISYILTAAWIAPWFVFKRKRQLSGAVI